MSASSFAGGAVNCTASPGTLTGEHDRSPTVTAARWRVADPVLRARLLSPVLRLLESEWSGNAPITCYLLLDSAAEVLAMLKRCRFLQVLATDPVLVAVDVLPSSLPASIRSVLAAADLVLWLPPHARRRRGGTGIEWADETWNPIAGCQIVSAGCSNCYAMATAASNEAKVPGVRRLGRDPGGLLKYVGLTERGANGRAVWSGAVALGNEHEWRKPFGWSLPKFIFVNSMSDPFYEGFSDEVRDRLFAVMADRRADHHCFLLLTKRAEAAATYFVRRPEFAALPALALGVTVESGAVASRIDVLRSIPVARRWLSVEPLIGPLPETLNLGGIQWVITGGESGPVARIRRCHPDWVRGVRDACARQSVRFFHKQWGHIRNNPLVVEHGLPEREAAEIDTFGAGGALLDGLLHRDRPDW